MKKDYILKVKGNEHSYCFDIKANPKYINEWREDGLEIYEIVNKIPEFIVDLNLTRIWCFLQDLCNLRNPFVN